MPSTVWRVLCLIPLLAADAAAQGAPGQCTQAIGPDSARRLFAALVELRGADGCALDDVRTDKDIMRVVWKKNGAPVPAIELRPSACSPGAAITGRELAASVPADAAAQCPTAVAKIKAMVSEDALGAAVKIGSPTGVLGRRGKIAAGAGAALLVLAALGIWMWRRRRRAYPPDRSG